MKTDGSCVPFYVCMLQCNIHRGMQGRLVRNVVLVALWIFVAVVCQSVYGAVSEYFGTMVTIASVAFVAVSAGWVAFRLIQHPPVADFLIDVQIESSKVSWCTWPELRRTTIIVLAAMIAFSAYLFACDISWQFVLRSLSILNVQ